MKNMKIKAGKYLIVKLNSSADMITITDIYDGTIGVDIVDGTELEELIAALRQCYEARQREIQERVEREKLKQWNEGALPKTL